MKKILLTILCLAFVSLACLSTSGAVIESPEPVILATRLEASQSTSEPIDLVGESPTMAAPVCARVVAIAALNLRRSASSKAVVLAWLQFSNVVQVLDQSNAEWWRVRFDGVEGFARSSYLEQVECVK